jgi:hypothetical protein
MNKIFQVSEIQNFWDDSHKILPRHDNRVFGWAGMRGRQPTGETTIYLPDLLQDVLKLYDAEPLSPSMAGAGSQIISAENAWCEEMMLLATPLWAHILETGTGYLAQARKIMEESNDWFPTGHWSILICACAHDLGKLRKFRPIKPEKYKSKLHPQYGADAFDKLIGNRLPTATKERFVQSVRNHHDLYKEKIEAREYLTAAVILADRLARGKETEARAKEYFQTTLNAASHNNTDIK